LSDYAGYIRAQAERGGDLKRLIHELVKAVGETVARTTRETPTKGRYIETSAEFKLTLDVELSADDVRWLVPLKDGPVDVTELLLAYATEDRSVEKQWDDIVDDLNDDLLHMLSRKEAM
jgi:hypothetical protein